MFSSCKVCTLHNWCNITNVTEFIQMVAYIFETLQKIKDNQVIHVSGLKYVDNKGIAHLEVWIRTI